MREPTDDKLIAALLDVLPGEDWVRDPDWNAATMIRAAVEAPTRDAMLKEMGEDAFSDTVGRARLADELCRRFPQPITDAVLGECGFVAFEGAVWTHPSVAWHLCAKLGDAIAEVAWNAGRNAECVRDARRLRELVAGLGVVYGRREG